MNEKIDVVICTRDESNVRPKLMSALESSSWRGKIILETSSPLSYARVRAIRHCFSDYVLYLDDDVEIPKDLAERYLPHMKSDVIAVSSQAYDQNKHWLAYRRALYQLYPNHHAIKGNFDNRAFIIRRSFMEQYNPPPLFFCEDTHLHKAAMQKGKWVHLEYCGVNHYPHYRNWAYWGYAAQQLKLNERSPVVSLPGRLLVSYISFLFTLDLKTLHFSLKYVVQWFSGYLMAKLDGE